MIPDAQKKKCQHQAGWWTDDVLIWGDPKGVYLEQGSGRGRKRRRGKLVLKCNMQGCGATRNVYFDQPIRVKLGKVQRVTL